jgi:hypothetical protein
VSDIPGQQAASEICALATAFLDKIELSKILKKYRFDDNIDDEDLTILLQFADAHPSMQRVHDPRFPDFSFIPKAFYTGSQLSMARMHNPYIALAIARKVIAGQYSSIDDKLATRLIEKNLVPGERCLDAVQGVDQWRPRKLSPDEYYEVMSEAWPDKAFQKALRKAIKAIDKVHGDYLDRYVWYPARDRLDEIPYKLMLRRGWVSDPNFWSAAMQVRRQNFDIFDKKTVLENFSRPHYAEFLSIDIGGEQ